MNVIKFSHIYNKMPEDVIYRDTILLDVFKVEYNELSERFKMYDTLIKGKNPFYKESYFQIPRDTLIVLLLKTNNNLWTTIRRWTLEKEEYYRSIRGQEVEIKIEVT